jgi:hypothetical protein
MISTVQTLGFLMEVQEGRKGQGGAHSLICSLGEFEREHEDEVCCYVLRKAWALLSMEATNKLRSSFI